MSNLRQAAFLVRNERGYESLHLDRSRAEQYAVDHSHNAVVEPLVLLSDVLMLIESMFPRKETTS